MKRLILFAINPLFVLTPVAFADEKPSADEAAKITAALTALGCSGGAAEKETEATGVFEVDDAKCKDGQFDVKVRERFQALEHDARLKFFAMLREMNKDRRERDRSRRSVFLIDKVKI